VNKTSYVAQPGRTLPTGGLEVWRSPEPEDPGWDSFLESTTLGQFQQSSGWGQYKQTEGWNVFRVVLTREGRIVGGFQILWKTTRLGRIGYISKGPVIQPDEPGLTSFVVNLVQSGAAELKLRALIVQAPDLGVPTDHALADAGFLKIPAAKIIDASCMLDLTQASKTLESGFSASARRNVRLASRAGVMVREGTSGEIAVFHDLMVATCARQGVTPNPPTAAVTEALWQSLSKGGHARLTFASYRDEIIAGKLCILFGKRASLFKVGWNGQHPRSYPNERLEFEALCWAQSNGFATADWVGLSRATALAVLEGNQSGEAQASNIDRFKLRFGGRPVLLPSALVWISNPLLRRCYQWAFPVLIAATSSRRRSGDRSNS
jgi:lipid II:glycine glycyltransferase (peptidoglycan interpeptide bridge formation enzyme)